MTVIHTFLRRWLKDGTAGASVCLPTLLRAVFFCVSIPGIFGQAGPEAQLHSERGLQLMQAGNLPAAEVELRQAVKLSPRDPTFLGELGVVLGMEQKFADSNHYFQQALELNPGNVSIRRNLAKNQWRLGEYEAAEANLQRVLKAQPGDGESTLILGMIEEHLAHFAVAARLLNSVPGLANQHPEAIVALARCYYQVSNSRGARDTLRRLLQDNSPPEALYLGGQTALQAEDFETAEELFSAARRGYPDAAKLGYFLALTRYRSGKYWDCQQTVLETLTADPPTRDLYELLGWCYGRQDRIREATEAFDRAVALDPSNETTYLDLGAVLLDHHQDELALALGKETTGKFPSSFRALMLRGIAEADLGYLTQSVKSFGRAVELNPGSPAANYDLAMVQSLAGFADDGLGTLERGTSRFPGDPLHFQAYASLEVQRAEGGDPGAEARAYAAVRKALSLDNTLPESHLILGRLEFKNNRLDQAMTELETAARLDPNNSAIHLALSRAYARRGASEKAAKELAAYKSSAQAELQGGRGRTPVALRPW